MLSEKIYALRRKSGLSQEQLAEKIGVSRQAISKWEGGLSTPELDKLRALSEFFKITMDELTGEQGEISAADTKREAPADKTAVSKVGVGLCLLGAVCLIAFGILIMANPSAADRINESSMITLNGSGILIILFVAFMAAGVFLTLRKR